MRLIHTLIVSFSLALTIHISAFAADVQKGWDAYGNQDYESAMKVWLPLAEQGNPQAQLGVSLLYTQGLGVSEDQEEAFKWTKRSADNGNASAQFLLGRAYIEGKFVERDPSAAIELFERSAN